MNNASLYFRRTDLTGRTDKYGFPFSSRSGGMQVPAVAIEDAIAGLEPLDVTNGIANFRSFRDDIIARLARYREGYNFYKGDHYANPYEEGEKKAIFNYVKTVADKAVDWFVPDGWKVSCPQGNEQLAELLNLVWCSNGRGVLSQRGTQFGVVTGDHYLYVTLRTVNEYNRPLPRGEWSVKLQVLPPENCFPLWSDTEQKKMRACVIQYPVENSEGEGMDLFTILITDEIWRTWINDSPVAQGENPLGEVNVVHFPNLELAESNFGQSDIEQIIPINEEYNLTVNQIRKIIKYHAEPTTLIYGARASTLEKGAKKVWSNLPKPGEAKVENLQLESDLSACFNYLSELKLLICQLSNTPKIALDSFEAHISNSSGVGLELMFLPLIEKTARRQIPHKLGVNQVNRLIMKWHAYLGEDIYELVDHEEAIYETDVVYTGRLPRDEAQDLDLAIKKVSAGVWSQAEMIRRFGQVTNHQRLILELIADKRQALAEAYEKQRATLGERPNSLVAFLGSATLSEELSKLQSEIAVLEKLAGEGQDKKKPLKVKVKQRR